MSIESRYLHTLTIKKMAAVISEATETVGGASTTLTADTAAGAAVVSVASAAGITAGDFLRIGDVGEREVREVDSVLTLAVTLTAPLQRAHDSGDAVREVSGTGSAATDEYGQPVVAETTVATVPGLVQPRRAREVELASQAGAVVADYVAYCDPLATITTACWVEVGGGRYDVVSVADAAGLNHHLELGLRRVS